MRMMLNLEELHVETTEMQSDFDGPEGLVGFDGAYADSVLWDTLTRPIQRPNTNPSPCIA
jgi:hypothetical protein